VGRILGGLGDHGRRAVICYSSPTGTKANAAELRRYGWRLICSPATNPNRFKACQGMPYALDNGAWNAHQSGKAIDLEAFQKHAIKYGHKADFLIAPDIVGGGSSSLDLSVAWLPFCLKACRRVLLAVQDGHTSDRVLPLLSGRVGVAIGGTTEWKVEQLARRTWRPVSEAGFYLHCLRVNTKRRIELAATSGCHSFDGSSPARFSVTTSRLTRWAAQSNLFGVQ
jgi:hypothetical protein